MAESYSQAMGVLSEAAAELRGVARDGWAQTPEGPSPGPVVHGQFIYSNAPPVVSVTIT